MADFFKITKKKIRLLILIISLYFAFSFISNFSVAFLIRSFSFEYYGKISAIASFLSITIISYIIFVFLKRKKGCLREFLIIFLIFLISEKLLSFVPILFFKWLPSKIYYSNNLQIAGFILQFIIFYIAVCFVDKFVMENKTQNN